MTKRKRKSKRQAAARRAENRPAPAVEQPQQSRSSGRSVRTEDGTGPRSARTATRQRAGAERPQPVVVYPPLSISLARGMRAVGTSPALLVTTFLGALALWLGYSGYGVDLAASPSGMILLESLPPFQSFLDVQLLAAGRPASSSVLITSGLGVMAARALLVTVSVILILRSLQPEKPEADELTPSSTRHGIRKYPVMLGIQAILLMVMFTGLVVAPVFLGAQFGPLGSIVALLAGMYFFVFAPVVAVAEGVGLREAFRLSIRAARVPGPRHVVLTFSYVAFSLFLLSTAPVSPDLNATPSVVVWLYALFVAFLHVSVLAALTFRWLFVREHVLQEASAARSARAR
jgi:hypothetical protein